MTETNIFITLNIMCCACFVQTLQDIAKVWMETAGSVMCDINVCRKHGAKCVMDTLYARDPNYVEQTGPGKRAHRGSALYSTMISNDWGIDSSNMRDDDMKLVVRMFRGLFAGEVPNAPELFHTSRAVFTLGETTSCLGLSTMTENALDFFKGKWWQWRRVDNIRSLLDSRPAVIAGLDRLTNTKDYGPYGQPETRSVQEAAGGMKMPIDDRAGSADTLPDDCEYEGPSLGAYRYMHIERSRFVVR